MSAKRVLSVAFAVTLLWAVVALSGMFAVSADSGVAPAKFCEGGVAWIVRGQTTLSDPKCSGTFVLDQEGKQSRFSSFAEAEKARGGKDATYWFEPQKTAVPTKVASTATATVTSTLVPTTVPTVTTDRVAKLISLDKIYRSKGWQAWLKAAGVMCDGAVAEARQPEEEVVSDSSGVHIVVSGLQVRGSCEVSYPVIVTTDRPGEVTLRADSRTYQPDLRNLSVLYTNVRLHGQGTIWVDGTNWGQLKPIGLSSSPVPTTLTPMSTVTPNPTSTSVPTNSPAPTKTSTLMPTATPTSVPPSTATMQPTTTAAQATATARPTATSVTMSSLQSSSVLPSVGGQNFLTATVGGGRLYWWGLILIVLAGVAGIVGIFFLAKRLLRRRAANPNP